MMHAHARRLAVLERCLAVWTSCPHCRDWAEPLLLRGAEQEAPSCPACGRRLPAVKLIRDPDFYHNADRLRQGTAADTR